MSENFYLVNQDGAIFGSFPMNASEAEIAMQLGGIPFGMLETVRVLRDPNARQRRQMEKLRANLLGRRAELHKPAELTPRQREVLDGILHGLANKQIAVQLGIEVRTVKFHVSCLLAHYAVESRHTLALHCLRETAAPSA